MAENRIDWEQLALDSRWQTLERLDRAAEAKAKADAVLRGAVEMARLHGATWQEVADAGRFSSIGAARRAIGQG